MDDPMRPSITDWDLVAELLVVLQLSGDFWLCRGALRCELLGELEDWDDFDIITNASQEDLFAAVSSAELSPRRTFYGGYSFRLRSGRKVDIWSLYSTGGRQCESLAQAMSCFEFNVDAIAKSIHTGLLYDPFNVYPELMERRLRLLRAVGVDQKNPYLPWKAAYLVLRHALLPDSDIIQLWEGASSLEGIPPHAIPALRDELRRVAIDKEVEARAAQYSGFDTYVGILAPWLSSGTRQDPKLS
jgi:hypothetical protein